MITWKSGKVSITPGEFSRSRLKAQGNMALCQIRRIGRSATPRSGQKHWERQRDQQLCQPRAPHAAPHIRGEAVMSKQQP